MQSLFPTLISQEVEDTNVFLNLLLCRNIIKCFFFSCLECNRDQGSGAGGKLSKLDISLAAQFSDHESQVRNIVYFFS